MHSLRGALHALADTHGLDDSGRRRLLQLAGAGAEPALLARWLPRGLAVAAAGLLGLGVVMWIAANWSDFGRAGRFTLLLGLVAATGLGAVLRPGARAPLGLLCLLGIGAVFAYFGQTYQTGADPWQLFALWAALGLPLCLGARSDVLWAPWALVAMLGISLWTQAQLGHGWRVSAGDLPVYGLACAMTIGVVALLSPWLRAWTGAAAWGLRCAATLAVVMLTATGLGSLFSLSVAPQYVLSLLALCAMAGLSARGRGFEVFVLSAAALGVNTLVVGGLARWIFNDFRGDAVGTLLVLGLTAAGLLAATVAGILKLARRHGVEASHA